MSESFQTFSCINNFSSVRISDRLMNEIKKEKGICVHKYLLLDYFIDSIIHRYFYMVAPSKWEDPFETKYLEALNGPVLNSLQSEEYKKILKDMSIFCTCMTYNDSDSEEASWKSYSENKEQLIRVSFNFDKLCEILNKATDENIFIGKLNYKTRKEILKPTGILNETKKKLEELYVNNFCLKQNAYQYEKELRFCVIKKGDQFKKEEKYIIEHIDLLPAIEKITLPPINHKKLKTEESKEKIFEQVKKALILKSLCPAVSIYVSNLYNPSEENMTSELIF